MKRRTIVFVSALQEELDPLWTDPTLKWSRAQERGDAVWFRQTELDGLRIIAAAACEMGLVASAILTTKLILRWQPELVIALGICAGRDQLRLGDSVLSSASFLYRFGSYHDGKFQKRERRCKVDPELRLCFKELQDNWKDFASNRFKDRRPKPRIIRGEYASADLVMKDERVMTEILAGNEDFYGLDMESYAIARAAEVLGVPYGAVIVKAVSDHGTASKTDKGRAFVKSVSKEVAIQLAKVFIKRREANGYRQACVPPDPAVRRGGKKRILALCPQQATFELLRERLRPLRIVTHSDNCGVPLAYTNSRKTLVVATMPKGHYGQVGAAIWSTVYAQTLNPALMLIVGACGGIKNETSLGDLVLANRAYHFQFGAFKSGKMSPEVRSIDIHDDIRGFLFSHGAESLGRCIEKFTRNYKPTPAGRPKGAVKWHIAPLASSDFYLKDRKKSEEAIKQDRKVVGVDMEAYAVMRVAKHSAIRLGAVIVRSVSDHADAKSKRYLDFARRLSVAVTTHLLRDGLENLVKRHS